MYKEIIVIAALLTTPLSIGCDFAMEVDDVQLESRKTVERTIYLDDGSGKTKVSEADLSIEELEQVEKATDQLIAKSDPDALSCHLDVSGRMIYAWCEGGGFFCWAGIVAGNEPGAGCASCDGNCSKGKN